VRLQDPNHEVPTRTSTWCSVPNYRYYRFTPRQARGFAQSPTLTCSLAQGKPDGCRCFGEGECQAGFCIEDTVGVPRCTYPVIQIAEIEFWRAGQRVSTVKVPDNGHDAFRIMNGVDVSKTWGVWELEFYSDTLCTSRLTGGSAIASSERLHGFGHSIDHTAPLGAHNTARTFWQSTHEPPLEDFMLHGPAHFAFDRDVTTNWWPTCFNPCRAKTEWLGRNYSAIVTSGVKCIRILQDKSRDFASFSLIVQGHRQSGTWETFTQFNAATWNFGGVWEHLSIPQGVAFVASIGHARALDFDLNSSVVELIGTPLVFDFGVETEIDSWRWATAEEPTENVALEHDGHTCDRDGLCPRDPVRWTFEGSLNGSDWVMLQDQQVVFPIAISRKRFIPFQPVHHQVQISLEDVWPDGRGKCAVRR